MKVNLNENKKIKYKVAKKLLNGYSIIATILITIIGTYFIYHQLFLDRIIPGVMINDQFYGNFDIETATAKLNTQINGSKKTLDIYIEDPLDNTKIKRTIFLEDADFQYLPAATIEKAYQIGRNGNFIERNKVKIVAFFRGIEIEPEYYIDNQKLALIIDKIDTEIGQELKEPSFILDENSEIQIVDSSIGKKIDVEMVNRNTLTSVSKLDYLPIFTTMIIDSPELENSDLEVHKERVADLINNEIGFEYNNQTFILQPEEIISIIAVEKVNSESKIIVAEEPTILKITEIAETNINRKPKGQILEIVDGKVTNFSGSIEGRIVDIAKSFEQFEDKLLEDTEEQPAQPTRKVSTLAVDIVGAPQPDNEYGIEELIAEGSSQFKGSNASRLHNIKIGAEKLDGTLIAPGEIFSFNKAIGPISKNNGFTSGWIISGSRLVLGDGGGICQVSTTIFRSALNGGLPIVERSAHSYRVGYYEQDSEPGLDATIYQPTLDFRFENDTENYILISTEYNAQDATLAIKFYGKNDGRKIAITEPVTTRQIAPGSPIYIEDPDIAEGRVIQREWPSWGANVQFTRQVEYLDGRKIEETFKSNFRPWRAVFLVGT